MAEKQSVLGRVTALAQADVSTLIDDSADPESLFLALARACTTTIAEAEDALASALAAKRLAEHDRAEDQQTADDWGVQAATAAFHASELRIEGNISGAAIFDDLARIALARQLTTEKEVAEAASVIAAMASYVEKLRNGLEAAKEQLAIVEERRARQLGFVEPTDGRILDDVVADVLDPYTELATFELKLHREDERLEDTPERASYLDDRFTGRVHPSVRSEVERRLELLRPDEDELVAALAARASATAERLADEAERLATEAREHDDSDLDVEEPEIVADPVPEPVAPPVATMRPVAAEEPRPEPEPAVEREPEPDVEAEPEPSVAAEDAPETVPQPAPEPDPEPELAPEPDPEPVPEIEPVGDDPARAPELEPETVIEPEPDYAVEREQELAPAEAPQPEPAPERQTEPAREPDRAPDAQAALAPRPEPQPEPEPEPEPEPALASEPAPEPQAEAELAPEPQPEPEPAPARPAGRRRADVPVKGPDDEPTVAVAPPPSEHRSAAPSPPSAAVQITSADPSPRGNPLAGIADPEAAYRLARAQEETRFDLPVFDETRTESTGSQAALAPLPPLPPLDEDELPTAEYPAIRFDSLPDAPAPDPRSEEDRLREEGDALARRRARRAREARPPGVPTAYDVAYDPTQGPTHPSYLEPPSVRDDRDAQVFPLRPRGDGSRSGPSRAADGPVEPTDPRDTP